MAEGEATPSAKALSLPMEQKYPWRMSEADGRKRPRASFPRSWIVVYTHTPPEQAESREVIERPGCPGWGGASHRDLESSKADIFRSTHASAALEVIKAVKYLFDSFTLDTNQKVLIEGSQRRHLTPKKFEILSMLVTNAGRLLTKSEILEQVWPDQIVEEGNLATHIHSIRQLLRDDPRNPRIIVTVQGFGYRFQPEVTVVTDWVDPPVLPAILDQSGEAPRRAFPRLLFPGLLAVLLVAVTIGSLVLTRFRAPASPAAPLPMQLTAYPGIEQYPTLSPDGPPVNLDPAKC